MACGPAIRSPLDGAGSGDLHEGTVRQWDDEQGWGVIDSEVTPGGCWTHFSAIVSDGYRTLIAGERVAFTMEPAQQDGYSYRSIQVQRRDVEGRSEPPSRRDSPSGVYRSRLTITVDGEAS